jgi:ubiquinone/menaquinone biosynthesis C-methylase UbiE
VDTREAIALIVGAMPEHPGSIWADFGAGDGTFTRALVELLGPTSRVYAVDRDATALGEIDQWPSAQRASVIPVVADLVRPFELPRLGGTQLDGALFANTLHFIRDPEEVLARLVALVKPGGRVVFVEYDRRASSRWVPFPIPSTRLPALAASVGLTPPVVTTTRQSAYGGELYVAASDREPSASGGLSSAS